MYGNQSISETKKLKVTPKTSSAGCQRCISFLVLRFSLGADGDLTLQMWIFTLRRETNWGVNHRRGWICKVRPKAKMTRDYANHSCFMVHPCSWTVAPYKPLKECVYLMSAVCLCAFKMLYLLCDFKLNFTDFVLNALDYSLLCS